ncbi:hypothetical protein [Cupriavidus sp. D39]|uniref:hypothetical protein n=1 Tax=Cupriavidus sp. D39 TaxID=2997877 RepID=UPI00226FC9B8|nr:hypothetical protein [Cupriavidus sp. D39]MCY0858086.1 hypothetical protein [Cupriavidus sp. D39]
MSQAQAVLGDVAKGKVSNAISALHGIRWAAGYAQSEDDIDAFLCLLDAVLPRVGAELEIVHSALGGTPVGYFAHAKRGTTMRARSDVVGRCLNDLFPWPTAGIINTEDKA